ncbi:MAG: hemerythrin domain-containing protein [Longimicrobiales bacterium]
MSDSAQGWGERMVGEEVDAGYAAVASSLDEVGSSGPAVDADGWALDVLADHIAERHHGYVRETLPVLRQFAAKVAKVHGRRHGELVEIRDLVEELGADLERHMEEEETVLFPRAVEAAA